MLTLCPAAEEGDVYVPEVQMLKMEMEMFIRQKSARYRAWFLLINTKKWHLDIWKRLVIHLKKISNLDIWKRLVIHLKKISKTLVKHLKWAYLVNRNKLHNGNVWEHSLIIILPFTFCSFMVLAQSFLKLDDGFQGYINYLIKTFGPGTYDPRIVFTGFY